MRDEQAADAGHAGDAAHVADAEHLDRALRLERLTVAARVDAAARAGVVGHDPQDLHHALAFLDVLDLRTLTELERELDRPDSMVTRPPGTAPGLAAFLGRRYAASIPASRYHPSTSVPELAARLLDTLVFREIGLAHGTTMFGRAVARVKDALGLPPRDSLAATGFAEYGAPAVFLLLDVAASFATVQLTRTSAHITASMGYSGMDAYADALDACHFMTVPFARHLLRWRPAPDALVSTMRRGRLDGLGISPTDIDEDRLLTELAVLRVRLPELSAPYSSWHGPGAVRRRPRAGAGPEDEVRRAFVVAPADGDARTAGHAFQQRLTRRSWTVRARERRARLAVAAAAAAMALSSTPAWTTAQAVSLGQVFLAGLVGAVGVLAWAALLADREEDFFRTAATLSRSTVLQGRRDAALVSALRLLRPDDLARNRDGGLGRTVTVALEREGVVVLGRGWQPVARFHWLHVTRISAPTVPAPPAATSSEPHPAPSHGRTVHRVDFVIRRDGPDVAVSLPLERAKVAWTQRSFVETNPLKALVSGMESARYGWALSPAVAVPGRPDANERMRLLTGVDPVAGTRYEKEALDWEFGPRPRPPVRARRRQAVLGALVVAAIVWAVVAPVLALVAS
ncbi:hypothetical protein [Georgenia muralis]|uniref:Uncharacterized protein n=1 Tax=Georgenia muralis TaxID=154117 RepID=A0A3N4ZTU7_9MICO|nr:hypothetical protein [Georgenia muralis]RPF28922.1 hypothetical protein EDD32_3473 [Georgenia muralis]